MQQMVQEAQKATLTARCCRKHAAEQQIGATQCVSVAQECAHLEGWALQRLQLLAWSSAKLAWQKRPTAQLAPLVQPARYISWHLLSILSWQNLHMCRT